MKKFSTLTAALALVSTTLAGIPTANAFDVYGKSNTFVKVTEDQTKHYVKFEHCSLVPPKKCTPIGARPHYSKAELAQLRNDERKDVFLAVGADIGLLIGAALTGGAVGYAVVGSGGFMGAQVLTALIGTSVGTGAGVAAVRYVDAINPHEQARQLDTLDAEVINDRQVLLDYEVEKFVKRLTAVLDNLE